MKEEQLEKKKFRYIFEVKFKIILLYLGIYYYKNCLPKRNSAFYLCISMFI